MATKSSNITNSSELLNYTSFQEAEDERGLPIIIVPSDTFLYRTDQSSAPLPNKEVPNFFTNRETVNVYKKNDFKITTYKSKTDLNLFNMNFESLKLLQELFQPAPDLVKFINLYYNKKLLKNLQDIVQKVRTKPGYKLETHEPTLQKILIKQVQTELQKFSSEEAYESEINDDNNAVFPTLPLLEPRTYLNRMIANIICFLGFDGWIVLPFNKESKQGLQQFTIMNGELSDYPPEIMICNWDSKLKYITSGGRRTSKRSHRHKKTRRNTRR